jgi:hypothetical protein
MQFMSSSERNIKHHDPLVQGTSRIGSAGAATATAANRNQKHIGEHDDEKQRENVSKIRRTSEHRAQ